MVKWDLPVVCLSGITGTRSLTGLLRNGSGRRSRRAVPYVPHRARARACASVSRETRTRDGRGLSVQSPFVHRRERELHSALPRGPPTIMAAPNTALHCTALPAIVGLGTRRRYTAVRRMRRQSVQSVGAVPWQACPRVRATTPSARPSRICTPRSKVRTLVPSTVREYSWH